jgi:pheromone shutdown-related protein TraB
MPVLPDNGSLCEDTRSMLDTMDSTTPASAEGPRRTVRHGDTEFVLLGTAHVSKASAEEVRCAMEEGGFDAVAVELCPGRHLALTRPDFWAGLDLFRIIREGKAGMLAASLALGAYQQRLADQFGIEPGAEMRAAIEAAERTALPVLLIDRDIGVTLKRVYRKVGWLQRMGLLGGLMASLLSRERVTEAEIERLKEGDLLETTFAEFAERSQPLYEGLIAERDHYMALRLLEEARRSGYRRVLVVVGAGHVRGLAEHLGMPATADPGPARAALEALPPPGRIGQVLPWVVLTLIGTAFFVGFNRSRELGLQLLSDWFIINGVLAALGALIALAHPLTVVAAFVAAPFTSLIPMIGAGFVAAALEAALRRPRVGDFSSLKADVTHLSGWWRNRVARVLLVFMFVTVGSASATYIAGFRIFERLVA